MVDVGENAKKLMPRGVRKGGARYPRNDLAEAVGWSAKLVSKTHLGPQPVDVVLAGVVGSKSSVGQVRISSLKQFGLLDGTTKAYVATDLAKKIDRAPEEELVPLYRSAALTPQVFGAIYNTFQGDGVTKAKLKQRAADLNVHPEEAEACVDNYIKTLQLAKLVAVDGETITHLPQGAKAAAASAEAPEGVENQEPGEEPAGAMASHSEPSDSRSGVSAGRSVVTVNITLDSSMDIEKLSKQLELLKKFGAI